MSANERVAYLRGLFEGLGLDATKKEGKLFAGMLDVLGEFATSLTDLEEQNTELIEAVDDLYMALIEGQDDCDEDDYYEYYPDEDDDELYQVTCPTCQTVIYLDEDSLSDGSIICEECGEDLEFDFSDLDVALDETLDADEDTDSDLEELLALDTPPEA